MQRLGTEQEPGHWAVGPAFYDNLAPGFFWDGIPGLSTPVIPSSTAHHREPLRIPRRTPVLGGYEVTPFEPQGRFGPGSEQLHYHNPQGTSNVHYPVPDYNNNMDNYNQ